VAMKTILGKDGTDIAAEIDELPAGSVKDACETCNERETDRKLTNNYHSCSHGINPMTTLVPTMLGPFRTSGTRLQKTTGNRLRSERSYAFGASGHPLDRCIQLRTAYIRGPALP